MVHQKGLGLEDMSLKPSFDVLIHSASFGGILVANELKQLGLKPLIMNGTGFPGGDMIQSLSCIQKSPSDHQRFHLPSELAGILYPAFTEISDESVFVDPEAWKAGLWRLIDLWGLDVLFHANIAQVVPDDLSTRVIYTDRSGLCEQSFKHVIDCSCRLSLTTTTPRAKSAQGELNVLATGLDAGTQISGSMVRVIGSRSLVTRPVAGSWLNQPGLELEIALQHLSDDIQKLGGRIQVLPMQSLVFSDEIHQSGLINPWGRTPTKGNQILNLEWSMAHAAQTLI